MELSCSNVEGRLKGSRIHVGTQSGGGCGLQVTDGSLDEEEVVEVESCGRSQENFRR